MLLIPLGQPVIALGEASRSTPKLHRSLHWRRKTALKKPTVFISYSHADSEFVDELVEKLQASGVDVWIDKWMIRVGDSITGKINEGIGASNFLIVILSRASVNSKWVREELNAATIRNIEQEKQAFIIPVLIEECEIPSLLQHRKYANFIDEPEQAFQELLDAIQPVRPSPKTPQTEPLPSAPVTPTKPSTYTFEHFTELVRFDRISDAKVVDYAWVWVTGLRDACGRWPRDVLRVTADLDLFSLRVLRLLYNRTFDDRGVTEGMRILGLFSYADLHRFAAQSGHEKALRWLNDRYSHGLLNEADIAEASKKGLGAGIVIEGHSLTALLEHHYRTKAFIISSFRELEKLTGQVKQGTLDAGTVQDLKKSGKLIQVESPWDLEETPNEKLLKKLLGPEYWYLSSSTEPDPDQLRVLIAHHTVKEGQLDEVLFERLFD